ncbi:UNVERIFIED_CONTAM: hypothetical protein NCL1_51734 [Trichonephila clavipes]
MTNILRIFLYSELFPGTKKWREKKDFAIKFGIPPNSLSAVIKNRDKLQNYDSSNSCSKRAPRYH